jgi:alpha-amylase
MLKNAMKVLAFGLISAATLVACGQAPQQTDQVALGSDSNGTVAAQAVGDAANPSVWRKQIIYFTLPDRFYNGNTGNDNAGAANCFDLSNPRKFHGGDWAGLQQKLSYIKDLGGTALWVTPPYKQIGQLGSGAGASCGYHGYWADWKNPDDTAVEPKMGTSADLTNLITATKNNNVKFILDMVVNHAGYGAQIVSSNPSWFQNGPCPDDISCPLAGLPDFRHQDPAVATYLTNQSKAWTSQYAIDAIRMDTVKHVLPSYFQNSWSPGVCSVRSKLFLLGEILDPGSLNTYNTYFPTGYDSFFNFYVRQGLVNSIGKAQTMDDLAGRVQASYNNFGLNKSLMMVNLLDNHDVPRFTTEPGFGVSETEIRNRYHLALTAMFTIPGIPQIYYGNEIGMYGASDPDNRKDMPSWVWTDAGRAAATAAQTTGLGLPSPKLTYDHTKKLAGIRTNNPALYDGYYSEMWRHNGSGPNVYAFFRAAGSNRIVTAVNNGTLPSGLLSMNLQSNTGIQAADKTALADGIVMEDILGTSGQTIATLSEGALKINLGGQSAGIYRPRTTGSIVSFKVRASTSFGESIYLVGSTQELGAWDLGRKIKMVPSNCAGSSCDWTVVMNRLPLAQAMQFKFTRNANYEAGGNRSFTVPNAATGSYNGGNFQ